jgi:Ca2+-binding RTX toxin-like protein
MKIRKPIASSVATETSTIAAPPSTVPVLIGPSTTQTPYLVSTSNGVAFTSILSVGDQVGLKSDGVTPWKMVGIPDGLGAYDNGDGTLTVLMNHEIRETAGVVREHGTVGSFVSKLVIDKTTLEVTSAEDLVKDVFTYDSATDSYVASTLPFGRFCSADLPNVSALYDANTGLGTTDRIFLTGEETGPEGRAFAHIVNGADAGKSYELPWLGNMSYENVVANANTGVKTVIAVTDDATPGEVYIYVGDKKAEGSTIEKAGLTDGKLYGIVADFGDDTAGTPTTGTFTLSAQGANGDVSALNGAQLSTTAGALTQFGRPEDSAWDPSNPNRLYVATTGTSTIPTRLFAVDFKDAEHPELGGTITVLFTGGVAGSNPATGPVMIDNFTVTESGLVILQEDPGNNARLAKVWMYDPKADNGTDPFSGLTEIAQHDPARFTNAAGPTGTPAPFSTTGFGQDEESSGVVEVTSLLGVDRLAFMLDTQAHYGIAGELVEGGQLMTMYIDLPNPGDTEFEGTAAADTFDGGFGNDELEGRGGDDKLFGNYGNDEIDGGNGNDILDGGVGNDEIKGGIGNDMLDGGVGDDELEGGAGIDKLFGGVGNDELKGDAGDDTLNGGFGNDELKGGSGSDKLFGDQGNDRLNGGFGNDMLSGGGGDDWLNVSSGNDTITFGKLAGHDTVEGFDANAARGQDLIDLSSLGLTAATFATDVTITAVADGTLVSLISGDTILLEGVRANTVTINDFII